MSPFVLILSNHSRKRIKERLITRFEIRRCVARGESVSAFQKRQIKELRLKRGVLEVVYLEIPGGVEIVTAYWK